MGSESGPELTDKTRLLFGSGFVFGVMFALVVLGVATATVAGDVALESEVLGTTAAGILFSGIVAVGLYVLAFPENRVSIPVETLFEDDG